MSKQLSWASGVNATRLALIGLLAVALAVAAFAVTATRTATDVAAFENSWTLSCNANVSNVASQRDLFDDSPGAGGNNESGFFWVKANDANDEFCTASSSLNLSAGVYRNLSMRAAVNDGAKLIVAAYSQASCAGTLLGQVRIEGAEDDSSFRNKSATLSSGTIMSMCIYLDDDPNTHAQRISALIDQIRLSDTSGAIGWQERFSRSN